MASKDLRTKELKSPIKVAEYLFQRLHEVGIRAVHGVPGDYNLELLDFLPNAGLSWVGNVNELNAGYAADGYARIKGISALITTFGVGELSAINAIAGAYSEMVPVIHIVGTPSTSTQADGKLLHHTLGNGDFTVFANMARYVSCASVNLLDPHEVAAQIDDVIRECYIQSRPVYIFLPMDVVHQVVDGEKLKMPVNLEFKDNEAEKEDHVVKLVLDQLYAAKNPVILVDACASRHRAQKEILALITKTNLPTVVAPMGKSTIPESLPSFLGLYAGAGSPHPHIRELVESSDLVLSIGAVQSDFNTAGFSYSISQLKTIDFHSTFVAVGYAKFEGVKMNGVLSKMAERVELDRLSNEGSLESLPPLRHVKSDEVKSGYQSVRVDSSTSIIKHEYLWTRLSTFLRPDDIVITETGTANFGIWETTFPDGVIAISQILWGSIGYATAACQGAALAAVEEEKRMRENGGGKKRRTILLTGEGSLQLTAQELSTMVRLGLKPIIFVICNEGYTIERLIHGLRAAYNDIQPWKFKDLPAVFGATPENHATYVVKTPQEMEKLLNDQKFGDAEVLQFVEVHMPKEDAPKALELIAGAKDSKEES